MSKATSAPSCLPKDKKSLSWGLRGLQSSHHSPLQKTEPTKVILTSNIFFPSLKRMHKHGKGKDVQSSLILGWKPLTPIPFNRIRPLPSDLGTVKISPPSSSVPQLTKVKSEHPGEGRSRPGTDCTQHTEGLCDRQRFKSFKAPQIWKKSYRNHFPCPKGLKYKKGVKNAKGRKCSLM